MLELRARSGFSAVVVPGRAGKKKTGQNRNQNDPHGHFYGNLLSIFFKLYVGMSTKAPNVAIEGPRLRKMSQISMFDIQVR